MRRAWLNPPGYPMPLPLRSRAPYRCVPTLTIGVEDGYRTRIVKAGGDGVAPAAAECDGTVEVRRRRIVKPPDGGAGAEVGPGGAGVGGRGRRLRPSRLARPRRRRGG